MLFNSAPCSLIWACKDKLVTAEAVAGHFLIFDEEQWPVSYSCGAMQWLMKYNKYHHDWTLEGLIYKWTTDLESSGAHFSCGAGIIQADPLVLLQFPRVIEWNPPFTLFLDILSDICCRYAGYNLYGILNISVLHSHWSRNVEARLSLVERIIVLLRQLSYAIKNQLVASKAPY